MKAVFKKVGLFVLKAIVKVLFAVGKVLVYSSIAVDRLVDKIESK